MLFGFLGRLFDTSGFPPRWHCGIDLGSAVVLLGAIGMLMTWGPDVFNFLAGFMKRSLSEADVRASSAGHAVSWVAMTFWQSIGVLLPIDRACRRCQRQRRVGIQCGKR